MFSKSEVTLSSHLGDDDTNNNLKTNPNLYLHLMMINLSYMKDLFNFP